MTPERERRILETAGAEWARRVEAEYRSAALTANLAHWLVQVSVSPDLVREALSIVDDELAHAADSMAVVEAIRDLGASIEVAPMRRESLAYRRMWEPLELDVTAACLETFCLGETVAVPLFRALRAAATVPVARAALDRVLADEVRHRAFGWVLLEHLLTGNQGGLCREFATAVLPEMFERLTASYAAIRDEVAIEPELAVWGLMPGREYARALATASARDYRPRLSALGLVAPVGDQLDRLESFSAT